MEVVTRWVFVLAIAVTAATSKALVVILGVHDTRTHQPYVLTHRYVYSCNLLYLVLGWLSPPQRIQSHRQRGEQPVPRVLETRLFETSAQVQSPLL